MIKIPALAILLATTFAASKMRSQVFQQVYPTTYDRTVFDILRTSDGGYLLAGMSNNSNQADCDLYLLKTDAAGNKQWDTIYAGAKPEQAYSMVETSDGILIAGYTQSMGSGDYNTYAIKLNQNGKYVKHAVFGGHSNDEAQKVIKAHEGGYLLLGTTGMGGADDIYLIKVDSELNKEWEKTYDAGARDIGRSITKTPDGGYLIAGQTTSKGADGFDAYVLKLKSDYSKEWDANYGGARNQEAVDILANDDGSFILLVRDSLPGVTPDGNIDIRAIKADASGSEIWNKQFGGAEKDTPKSIRHHNGGYIIGAISRSGKPAPDMWLLYLNQNGDKTWETAIGDPYEHDHCHMAKPDIHGGILAIGHQQKPMKKVLFARLDGSGLVGIKDQTEVAGVKMYPNPASGFIHLSCENAIIKSVRINDLIGRTILDQKTGESNHCEINLNGHRSGTYLVTVETSTGNMTSRIVIH